MKLKLQNRQNFFGYYDKKLSPILFRHPAKFHQNVKLRVSVSGLVYNGT